MTLVEVFTVKKQTYVLILFSVDSIRDLDIEPDPPEQCGYTSATAPPCCRHNWLTISITGSSGAKSKQYCGRSLDLKPIRLSKTRVTVKFHISRVISGGRGFLLTYNAGENTTLKLESILNCLMQAELHIILSYYI